MPALIDSLPLGRLRARLSRWLWLAGGLAGLGLGAARGFDGVGEAVAVLMVGSLGGWALGAILTYSIRCPACGHRLLWDHYDDDTGLVADPLESRACPRCGSDPSEA